MQRGAAAPPAQHDTLAAAVVSSSAVSGASVPPAVRASSSSLSSPRTSPLLSGTTARSSHHGHRRAILHLDLDCFYAQVEMNRQPSLRERPVAVLQKSLLVTTNYVARRMGVKKMTSAREGRAACPDLVVILGENLDPYRAVSQRIFDFLRAGFPRTNIQRLGLDEFFVDLTEAANRRVREQAGRGGAQAPLVWCGHVQAADGETLDEAPRDHAGLCPDAACDCPARLSAATAIAMELRTTILEELGYSCCGGISYNKMLAKMAGELHKPAMQSCILPTATSRIMHQTPLAKIPNCGRLMRKTLAANGIHTTADVLSAGLKRLRALLGDTAGTLALRLCSGIDDTDVTSSELASTMSNEDSMFVNPLRNVTSVVLKMEELTAHLLRRVRAEEDLHNRLPRVFRVAASTMGTFQRVSRQCRIPPQVWRDGSDPVQSLLELGMGLFQKIFTPPYEVRLLNVAVADFADAAAVRSLVDITTFTTPAAAAAAAAVGGDSSTSEHEADAASVVPLALQRELGFDTLPLETQRAIVQALRAQTKADDSSSQAQAVSPDPAKRMRMSETATSTSSANGGGGAAAAAAGAFQDSSPDDTGVEEDEACDFPVDDTSVLCPICLELVPAFCVDPHREFHRAQQSLASPEQE